MKMYFRVDRSLVNNFHNKPSMGSASIIIVPVIIVDVRGSQLYVINDIHAGWWNESAGEHEAGKMPETNHIKF